MITLVVVEEPQAVYLSLDTENEALHAPPTPRLVTNGDSRTFITSSVRGTLRHLRKEAGPYAPWRGFGANLLFALTNGLLRAFIVGIMYTMFPMWLASSIGGILSMLVVSRFALAVTQYVPSSIYNLCIALTNNDIV